MRYTHQEKREERGGGKERKKSHPCKESSGLLKAFAFEFTVHHFTAAVFSTRITRAPGKFDVRKRKGGKKKGKKKKRKEEKRREPQHPVWDLVDELLTPCRLDPKFIDHVSWRGKRGKKKRKRKRGKTGRIGHQDLFFNTASGERISSNAGSNELISTSCRHRFLRRKKKKRKKRKNRNGSG